MNLLGRIFGNNKNQKANKGWTMFSTSKREVKELLVDIGETTINNVTITIKHYPFEPSIAFRKNEFKASDIDNIDPTGYPPTLKVGNELIFISAMLKEQLAKFASDNNIDIVDRKDPWVWILEPFLDTEFTEDTKKRLTELLSNYGLTKEKVYALRQEVETQMLKYNFDTMLWEWGGLGSSDVLRAMRTKYDKEKFKNFYNEVMRITLLTETTNYDKDPSR